MQSFTNLNYRHDPAGSDHHNDWGTLDNSQLGHNRKRPNPLGKEASTNTNNYDGDARRDARPYASTNVIHQPKELDEPDHYDERNEPARRHATPAQRHMRFFGDTDLESQQSGHQPRYRYAPRAKVLRSASSAAGMGGVRRYQTNSFV